MSRTIKKQQKRDRPRAIRQEGYKKVVIKKLAFNDSSDDEDEQF